MSFHKITYPSLFSLLCVKKTEIQKYIDEWKKIYDYFIKHQIDSDSIDIDIQHFEKNREEYEHFLRLLISIYSNHSHEKNLFEKIEQIIVQLKESIKQTILFNIRFISHF